MAKRNRVIAAAVKHWKICLLLVLVFSACAVVGAIEMRSEPRIRSYRDAVKNAEPNPGWWILVVPRGGFLQDNIRIKQGERKTVDYILETRNFPEEENILGFELAPDENIYHWGPLPEGLKVYALFTPQRPDENRLIPIVVECSPELAPGRYVVEEVGVPVPLEGYSKSLTVWVY